MKNPIKTVVVNDNSRTTYSSTPFELLLQELDKHEGRVLVGLVHESLYGPAKGMFAVIKPNNPTQLHAYLNSPAQNFSRQEDVVVKFWEKTQMATRMMILPFEWVQELNLGVPEFESVKEFNTYMLKKVKEAPGMENPWYFRVGDIK
jgi:hypothetical protein